MHLAPSTLKKILTDAGLVSETNFQKAQQESARVGAPIQRVLIDEGYLEERYLAEAVAEYLGLPLYHPNTEEIAQSQFGLISEATAKSYGIFLIGQDEKHLKIALTDPTNLRVLAYLETKYGARIEPYLITENDHAELLTLYKRNIGKEFNRIIEENTQKIMASSSSGKGLASEIPVITMFDTILEHGVRNRASDIHIEGAGEHVLIRYRIDGILHDVVEMPISVQAALVARIKILANLQIDEHRTPQDGRFSFTFESDEIATRVSIMPTLHGEKVVLRLLARSRRLINLTDLGATKVNLELLERCIKRSNGLILVTGPTGSGKTTTLYTLLSLLNKPEVSISTIEDPIEYDIARVNQTQVNPKTGLTFAEGLRAFLRQNPDIMMVGEIRDPETAELGVHSSLTGHLVLSTLHTDDAASAIPRLLDLKAEPFLVASTLRTVIAQRLVRRICTGCTASQTIDEKRQEIIKEQLLKANPQRGPEAKIPTQFYYGKGCAKCGNTGYHGQVGIFEVLDVNEEISELILKRTSADTIKKQALATGMTTMFEDGLEKAESGVTTIDEILRVIRI